MMLTDVQEETFWDIVSMSIELDHPPTVRQLAERAHVSVHCIHDRMRVLRIRGLITWEQGKQRTIEVLDFPEVQDDPVAEAV